MKKESMSKDLDELKIAKRLYQEQKFATLIKLLASHVFIYRQVADYFKLIGLASLRMLDFSGAHSYLLRANDLKPDCVEVLIGLACTYLQRREETNAVSILLKLGEQKKYKALAEPFLNYIRSNSGTDWSKALKSAELVQFFPRISFNFINFFLTYKKIIIIAASLVSILTLSIVIVGNSLATRTNSGREQEIVLNQNSKAEQMKELEKKLTSSDLFFTELAYDLPITSLSSEEQNRLLTQTSEYFNQYRDNLARQSANKLLLAEANESIIQKLKLLTSYFREPNFVNFRDNIDYQEISGQPWNFVGCYVRWTGKVSQLKVQDDKISFIFLKGYEKGRLVEATIPVELYFPIQLYNDAAIEIIAQVILDKEKKGAFFLRASSLRQIRADNF